MLAEGQKWRKVILLPALPQLDDHILESVCGYYNLLHLCLQLSLHDWHCVGLLDIGLLPVQVGHIDISMALHQTWSCSGPVYLVKMGGVGQQHPP